jgi:transcriptional regulator GlxA family with amidase domain
MSAGRTPFDIAIPIYPKVDLLDVAAPHEMFRWINSYSASLAVEVALVAAHGGVVETRDGLKLTPDTTFAECRAKGRQFDLLWVPGGDPETLKATMGDPDYLGFLREQAAAARWVTSVCEGALLLASAGLLDGYAATTHWAFIPCLQAFPEIQVADGNPRFVVDRNRVTGGGISSGLDEALELVGRIAGYEVAEQVQIVTQYLPDPPIHATLPKAEGCPLWTVS